MLPSNKRNECFLSTAAGKARPGLVQICGLQIQVNGCSNCPVTGSNLILSLLGIPQISLTAPTIDYRSGVVVNGGSNYQFQLPVPTTSSNYNSTPVIVGVTLTTLTQVLNMFEHVWTCLNMFEHVWNIGLRNRIRYSTDRNNLLAIAAVYKQQTVIISLGRNNYKVNQGILCYTGPTCCNKFLRGWVR